MSSKKLLIQRILFIGILMAISITCIFIMNLHFDSLSRYPYSEYMDESDKNLIKQHLNNDEIEYIIEYSIAPNTFLKYITCNGFSIYHTRDYNDLYNYLGYGSACDVVSKIELVHGEVTIEQLAQLMANYSSSEIDYWFSYKDLYNFDSILVSNPSALDVVLNQTYTMSNYVPRDLVQLDESIAQESDTQIQVSSKILIPLSQMCLALENEFSSPCGGLKVTSGYISFNDQASLYLQAQNDHGDDAINYQFYPGHSEHQTGLAIDFILADGSNFIESEQYLWLQQHASEYGFYASYIQGNGEQDNKYQHYRYTGVKTNSTN